MQWHRRTQVCGTGTVNATMPLAITGFPPCPPGSVVQPTPYVSMVWQVPVAGGPLAIQPPDIQIVEAAVMQSTAGSDLRRKDEGAPRDSLLRVSRRSRLHP